MLRLVKPRYQPIVISLLLLVVAASRLVRLSGLQMERDETWSVWQTFGSPVQIIRWTPYDWPPLFYLIVGAWRSLVGIQPVAIHVLPILVFLLGAALIYRVTRKLYGEGAAWLAIVAYAAMGYSIHLSTLLRGYIFLMTLAPLMLWLTLRYFDHPSVRRAAGQRRCAA